MFVWNFVGFSVTFPVWSKFPDWKMPSHFSRFSSLSLNPVIAISVISSIACHQRWLTTFQVEDWPKCSGVWFLSQVSSCNYRTMVIVLWYLLMAASKMADNMITDQRWPLKVPSTQNRIFSFFEFSNVQFNLMCVLNLTSHNNFHLCGGKKSQNFRPKTGFNTYNVTLTESLITSINAVSSNPPPNGSGIWSSNCPMWLSWPGAPTFAWMK